MSTRPPKTHYASSSSTDTDSSSPSSSDTDLSIRISMDVQPVASVEVLRCLRCHRHVEATSTDDPASTGMIRWVCFSQILKLLLIFATTVPQALGRSRLTLYQKHLIDRELGNTSEIPLSRILHGDTGILADALPAISHIPPPNKI
ncbi:hypothetical protein K445DRAFT_19388 [Daldinia sp. EC12]|nr:hypothetical protein K445DRAFT_19388 [Daldinia sp. EC12]